MQTLISQIRAILEDEDNEFSYMGLRVTQDENIQPGDRMNNSREWYDNEVVTDEDGDFVELNGTCCIGLAEILNTEITDTLIERALRLTNVYIGDQLILVGGKSRSWGDDDGEWIISEAQAVAVFERPTC